MLLNCHTYYSFCYGTLSPEALLDEVEKNGYPVFALTDINNTSACLNAVRLTNHTGGPRPKIVLGIDFRNGAKQQYVGIAKNNEGYKELNQHLSDHLHAAKEFDVKAPAFQQSYIIYPFSTYKGWQLKENEFIGVSVDDLRQLPFSPWKKEMDKLVVMQQVSFISKKQFNAHRLLRAIDTNNLLSKLPIEEQAKGNEFLIPYEELKQAYASFPHIISNAEKLLEDCSIHFEYGKLSNKNLRYYTDSLASDLALLKELCDEGLKYRYEEITQEIKDRIIKELDVIAQKEFASYFLINWDITSYARNNGYYYVGRGSGANSIVAYLLRITDVDPIELDLYFERFINVHRHNAPDFDIDFSWLDRDDITRYIFERFNKQKNVALLGAYNTFKRDASIRELGKVFGLPPNEIDRLQRTNNAGELDELSSLVLKYSAVIEGFPNHLSIHSSGIIISEKPICSYSATSLPPKGYPTTQFSMQEAEDIGLYKFDILSQRGLGKIKDALQIIKENHGVDIDVHNIPHLKEDGEIKKLLRIGDTIGCFYVESPGMRMLLAKLGADDYLRLVAASSIIRPGVAQSGMMREYILRYREPAVREAARKRSPELYDIMEETYGVMVYQEDVIRVAHIFAEISLAKADYLRRGMSWKFKERNEFFRVREEFFENCKKKGHEEKLVQETWTQIETFANFAFSKGHSASYAVESYQALYLKAHYPAEYMVATLNNGGGFYGTYLYIHEARKNKAVVNPPCINRSRRLCTIEGEMIYLGFSLISELEKEVIEAIDDERNAHGPFVDLHDFIKRVPISIDQIRILIRAGSFNFTGKNRKKLLWEVHEEMQPTPKKEFETELFEVKNKKFQLPDFEDSMLEEAFDQMELFGFTLHSPFQLLRDEIPEGITAKQVRDYVGKTIGILGYLVNIKRTSTKKGESMAFGTFIDQAGDWIDTVHFPPAYKEYPFSGTGCYWLEGKVTEEYDFYSIEISSMRRMHLMDRDSLPGEKTKTRTSEEIKEVMAKGLELKRREHYH